MAATQEHPDTPVIPQGKGFGLKAGFGEYLATLRLFSRNIRLYLLGSFFMGVNFQVFMLLLNLYLKEQGFPESDIGLVGSTRAIGMTLIAIPAAILLTRISLKLILLISITLFAVFSVGIVTVDSLELIMGMAVLSGMAFSFYRVAGGPFFMQNSGRRERTHVFSFSFGMMILAGMVGSLGAGHLATWLGEYTGEIVLGYRYTLYAGIAFSMLALVPFMMIRTSARPAEDRKLSLSWEQLKTRGRFYFRIGSVNFLVGLGAGLVIPFLNLYFSDRFNQSADTIGIFYFLVQCAMLVGSLSGPLLARRFGLVRTIVITQLASIPFLLVLSYSYILPLAVFAFVIRGGLMNLGWPIVVNLGMELSDKKEQGFVNALIMVAWTSSWMVSSAVGGIFIEQYGYTFTMNITIVLYVVSTVVFYLFFRHVETHDQATGDWTILKEKVS
ncbi:MAG: MFS transporter [candidate division Zixibacteria bacterium]|nr:MFS transporter [candidate division Zixibacteria bacterium]